MPVNTFEHYIFSRKHCHKTQKNRIIDIQFYQNTNEK